ncbi:MAG: DUF2059 domain-containing protein [Chitinophagales bacterium]|nr:DUF2059 domain-containing protein [Chitinophagales bacterium]
MKKLFEVSGTEKTYEVAIKQLIEIYRYNYGSIDQKFLDEMEKEFLNTSINDLVEMLTPIYKEYLTLEDLEGIIAFYESPVGKKYVDNLPFITEESMKVGKEWGQEIAEKIIEKMEKKAR